MNTILTQEKTILMPEFDEVIKALHYQPAVSVIMPFEPKMSVKDRLTHALETAVSKVERELMESYPDEICSQLMQKLRAIIKNLDYNTHKKSIAIYVSPVFEKLLYMDVDVQERIVVDESFAIRDLVYNKKLLRNYLVLFLTGKAYQMFVGNPDTLVRVLSNTSGPYTSNQTGESTASYTDDAERKQKNFDQFLHYIDNTLELMLHAYHLPLMVIGSEKILGHFKKITRHTEAVIEWVQGDYEDTAADQLKKVLEPYIHDWTRVKEKNVMNKLEAAARKNKLAVGMKEVWKQAMRHRGHLLVMENNFVTAQHGSEASAIRNAVDADHASSYLKDAVDEVIEKVLENGGDVEFVDAGVLEDFDRIALIYY